jgi:hypothetical protein
MWRSDQPVRCSNKYLRRERHITESATLRIKCARAHLMRELRTFGSVRGEGRDALAYSENRPLPDGRDCRLRGVRNHQWALMANGAHGSGLVLKNW